MQSSGDLQDDQGDQGDRTPRPLMVFDGDCGFCRYWVERLRSLTGDQLEYRPFQEVAGNFPAIPRQAFEEAIQLIEPGGKPLSGADALLRALEYAGKVPRRLARAYRKVPGGMLLARWTYHRVAHHRSRLGWTVPRR